MKNRYLEKIDKRVKVKITGNNVKTYLKRIINDIEIINMYPISKKEVHLILKYSDYKKLLKHKSIYKITILDYYGSIKIAKKIKKNYLLLISMFLGIILILILSKMIFKIEIIHQDEQIRTKIKAELNSYGIKKYSFKKNKEDLEKIKNKILNKNKDTLEWIEIIPYGTKYTIRVVERKINKDTTKYQYQHIVSKKNAIITEINAIKGEKVKFVNDYVKKGDIIISGNIQLMDNTTTLTMAKGSVLGSVWYIVDIDYPFVYQEDIYTGKSKKVYSIYFFNKRFSIFNFKNFHSFVSKKKNLITSNFLDIKLVSEKQYEVIIKDEVYTEEIVGVKAINYIKEKMMNDNKDIKDIKEVKILSTTINASSINFKMFVRTIEDIGEALLIENLE